MSPHLPPEPRKAVPGVSSNPASPAPCLQRPEPVQHYLDAVVQACVQAGLPIVSLVMFGSGAKGGFSNSSDVDLIVVLSDQATPDDQYRVRDTVTHLEIGHGFRPASTPAPGTMRARIERAAGHLFPCCVCTRSDLLAGDVVRVLGLRRWETPFLDRVVFASIVASAVTVWGEELLAGIPLPKIRRLDVFKALLVCSSQLALGIVTFPVLPDATKYAMAALKHSLHSCYFCYHRRTAALEEEIAFFNGRFGPSRTLVELLAMRRHYRPSFGFVIRCLPTLVALHLQTARDAPLPRPLKTERAGSR